MAHMENNNESQPVTRAHLFARIDATLLSQPPQMGREGAPTNEQDKEPVPNDTEAK
jgi:hypothetical protein